MLSTMSENECPLSDCEGSIQLELRSSSTESNGYSTTAVHFALLSKKCNKYKVLDRVWGEIASALLQGSSSQAIEKHKKYRVLKKSMISQQTVL